MTRPLVITDCDEVLLHMVSHFRDWLIEEHGIDFEMRGNDFSHALRLRESGTVVAQSEVWRLLNAFFDTEMPRQTPVPGAIEAIQRLREEADVVVLTNLLDLRRAPRREQLAQSGPGYSRLYQPGSQRPGAQGDSG